MASPRPIEPSSVTSPKPKAFGSTHAGTPPSIPNIPPRAPSTSFSGTPRSFSASFRPTPIGRLPAKSSNEQLTPNLSIKKTTPAAQHNTSALTAALGSTPAEAPALSRKNSNSVSLRPSLSHHNSGSNTPIRQPDESGFSTLADIPDEEKAKVLARHLVSKEERSTKNTPGGGPSPTGTPFDEDAGGESSVSVASGSKIRIKDDADTFPLPYDALGGDVTHDLYKWQQTHQPTRPTRSASFSAVPTTHSLLDPTLVHIKEPGGFRRNFVNARAQEQGLEGPVMLRNVIDFLFLYGHFAGEDLGEDDEEDESDDDLPTVSPEAARALENSVHSLGERAPLLGSRGLSKTRHRRQKSGPGGGSASVTQATLMLLKGFVGTGILFMGKAFFNGGILFSAIVLLSIAGISLWSFLLLVETYMVVPGSFGDIGGTLYGRHMRSTILTSITVSQIGFVAAYTIFIAENLQAFVLAVSDCKTYIQIRWLIFAQLIVFLPLAMIRNLAKLSGTALVADAFILIGLVYIGVQESTVLSHSGIADIALFNKDSFPLLIGTAVFAFEGIGLVIPITESMKEPRKFPMVLSGVMAAVAILFTGAGLMSYMAYGSEIQTVVIVNLPQDDKFVQAVQFLYSVAILLSIPLQLFPAVRIMENGLLPKSGKHNHKVKWQKNLFRGCTVVFCSLLSWAGSSELDKFVSLIGSFACIPLCFIYPPMLHLKGVATTKRAKIMDIGLIVFGAVVGIYTTVQTVRSLFVPSGEGEKFGKCEIPS
ncbi:solute carrier family 36 (proton-coupled amino acid transporter), partial [Tremellales sp. Uapishka_1]